MSGLSVELMTGWIDDLEVTEKWMALFAADPHAVSSPVTVEIVGGVYARQESLWVRSSPTLLTLTSALTWRNLPPGATVAAVGGFDEAFGGTFLFADLLPEGAKHYPAGGTFVLPAGEYVVGLDA